MMQNKLIFGLMGGSGCGKTSVGEMFIGLGAEIIDCDLISRSIMKKESPCLAEVCNTFGNNIIDKNGELKRRVLGDIVFSDKKKLAVLNKITHKYIYNEVVSRIEKSVCDFIGMDGAVLIGSGVDTLCECMISVVSDKEIRLNRIITRDNITEKQALERINSQKSNNFYIENSDYVIYNNSTKKKLEIRVREVWGKLVIRSSEKRKGKTDV